MTPRPIHIGPAPLRRRSDAARTPWASTDTHTIPRYTTTMLRTSYRALRRAGLPPLTARTTLQTAYLAGWVMGRTAMLDRVLL